MQSSGGLSTLAEAAAHPVRPLLSGPAGGVAAVAGLGGSGDAVASTWAALDRRLPHPRRRGAALDPASGGGAPVRLPHARHPHRRRGRRHDRLDRRRRRAASRAGERGRRPRPGLLRPGRHACRPSPTPTSCSAGSTRRYRWPAGCGSTGAARRRRRRGGRGVPDVAAAAAGIVAVANEEMVRAIRVVSVERGTTRGTGAGRVRRCRPAARLRRRRPARDAAVAGAGGRRRPLRARHRDRRPAHGHRSRA